MHNIITMIKNPVSRHCVMWLVALIATGCIFFPQDYDLPAEYRPAFKSGDRFAYKDHNTGRADTLEVSVMSQKYLHNKEDYYERLHIDYSLLNNGIPEAGFVSIALEIDLFVMQSKTYSLRPDTLYEDYTLPNGNMIHVVRRFISTNPAAPVSEVYYHYHSGVIKYIYRDGQALELQGLVKP